MSRRFIQNRCIAWNFYLTCAIFAFVGLIIFIEFGVVIIGLSIMVAIFVLICAIFRRYLFSVIFVDSLKISLTYKGEARCMLWEDVDTAVCRNRQNIAVVELYCKDDVNPISMEVNKAILRDLQTLCENASSRVKDRIRQVSISRGSFRR